MLSHRDLLRNITCYLFIIYILNLFTLPILVLISIITILMCVINHIYYDSPILILSFDNYITLSALREHLTTTTICQLLLKNIKRQLHHHFARP